MNLARLNEIEEKASRGEATVSEAVEVLCAMFLSSSKYQKASTKKLEEISSKVIALEEKLAAVEDKVTCPIFKWVDEPEDDEDETSDEEYGEV